MMHLTFWIMALLQLADAISTRLAIAAGAVELNPLMQGGLLRLIVIKLALLAVFAVLAARNRRLAGFVCGLYLAVVISNLCWLVNA